MMDQPDNNKKKNDEAPFEKDTSELLTDRLVPARARKYKSKPGPNSITNLKLKSCPKKKTKVKLGLKNLAILLSYFDYIFVHLRQKVRLRPELSPKFWSSLGPNPTRKALPDLQR